MNRRSAKGDFALGRIVIQHGSEANIQQAFQQYSNLLVTSDQAGLPGTFVQPNNHDFTPRIGAAYRVTPTFVIRGGFGIYAVDVTHNSFTDQYNQPAVHLPRPAFTQPADSPFRIRPRTAARPTPRRHWRRSEAFPIPIRR